MCQIAYGPFSTAGAELTALRGPALFGPLGSATLDAPVRKLFRVPRV